MEYIGLHVNVDKNLDSNVEARAYIHATVPGLCMQPVALLRDYLLRFRPPSGACLLPVPWTHGLQLATFRTSINMGRATYQDELAHILHTACHRTRVASRCPKFNVRCLRWTRRQRLALMHKLHGATIT